MENNLKFKVGDIVKVQPYSWYEFYKNKDGNVYPEDINEELLSSHYFTAEMAERCGDFVEIISVEAKGYYFSGSNALWQDWMLEDEPVNEEKQEVEPLNKNNMEAKKMTKKEAQELVKNTKYIVWSVDESRTLQEKLFEIGCKWGTGIKRVRYTEHPFLFVDDNLFVAYETRNYFEEFIKNNNQYKQIDDILNIEIVRPKSKFDLNTLQPFDKVLVRDGINKEWHIEFFAYFYAYVGYGYHCSRSCYRYCVPYNDETKHLLGTKNEAPEYYQVWK